MRTPTLSLVALLLVACGDSRPPSTGTDTAVDYQAASFQAPAGLRAATTAAMIDDLPGAVLPSGRFVTPAGTETSVLAPKPHVLCLARDGSAALTVNLMGTNPQGAFPFSATLIRAPGSGAPQALAMPVDATYNGCAFSADGARVYVAGGDNGNVWIADVASGQYVGSVNLSGRDHPLPRPLLPVDATLMVRSFKGAFPGRMVLSSDGNHLYVVDQGAFKLHVIDTRLLATGAPGLIAEPDNFDAVVASVDTGWYPYAVSLSADGGHLLVANVGVFRYTHLRPESPSGDAAVDYPLCYPAAGYPDDVTHPVTVTVQPVDPRQLPDALRVAGAIRCGYVGEARSVTVPAVGDPNALEASSVWAYALADPAQPALERRVKVGARIGERDEPIATYGASHPNAIAAGDRAVYVALGNHDAVAVLDPQTYAERARIALRLAEGADALMKGVLPSELALSADGRRLYVAEAGVNAVAVVDLGDGAGLDGRARVLGHIPTGWWPSGVALSPDGGTLYVSSAKGRGAGPSVGTFVLPPLDYAPVAVEGPKNSTIGTFNAIPLPDDATLRAYTQQVLRNNGLVATAAALDAGVVPARFGERSRHIRHVVLINKENAAYDFLLGHVTQTRRGAPVDGLPANSVGATVVPNHTELALQFALSDNFYLEPVSSSEGHRWLQGFYATEYEETHWPAAYGFRRTESLDDPVIIAGFPGRIGFAGANESPEPIDYNKHGGIFLHLLRNGRSALNFGNGTELANVDEGAEREPTGTAEHVNIPMMKALREHSDHLYAGFNLHIPDAPLPGDPTRYSRFGRFKQVFEKQLVVDGECRLPDYTTLFFPNDHIGAPDAVEPTRPWSFQRFVQDNDAALGLAVELISHSACWQDTVIFVVEDDTQNGADHVDGHRSILLAISPWTRREYVSHVHTSLPSVFKTIYLLLGVPPLNQYDAVATDLRDIFTATPDFTPYDYQPVSFLPPDSPQTRAWQRYAGEVDFGEMDGDEVRLREALLRALQATRQ